ncbi:MAG: lipopolysaccharide biosynthesis protein [Acidimicrobiia bacterium]
MNSSDGTVAVAPPEEVETSQEHVRAVARGGALNLVGSIVYGAANFALLAVITNALGAHAAGPVIVAIAVFTVMSRFAELGASTGLVRMISRDRALDRPERIAPTILAAVVPVTALGVVFTLAVYAAAPALAELFSHGAQTADSTHLLRILAPFRPISAVYTVLVQGSRGFGTMAVLVWIDKIGRACLLPIAALVVLEADGGASGVITVWAATTAGAALVTIAAVVVLVRRGNGGASRPAVRLSHREITRSFWSFSLPRAAGQTFDVAVLWLDTLLVAALIGPTAAGIYAAGTRYLLIGTFTAEAIQQAVAPKVSALIALGRADDARAVIAQATSWQAAITWPVYLTVIAFSGVLLGVFGPEYVHAQWALILLSVGLMVAVVGGPSDAVILMSGRSRQSLFNSAVAFTVNLGGNLLLVPIWGISAAGAVWAATLVVAAGLPALQARHTLGLGPWSAELLRTVGVAVGTVGTTCLLARLVLGESLPALAVAVIVGGAAYASFMWRWRRSVHLQALIDSFRGGPSRTVRDHHPRPILEHA